MSTCPEWTENIPSTNEPAFRSTLDVVHQLVARAASDLIDGHVPQVWHAILFQRFVPLNYYAGNYRQESVDLPCLAVNVAVAGVPGFSFQDVGRAIEILFAWVFGQGVEIEQNWSRITPRQRTILVAHWVATIVGTFIRIHPFVNGNGRVSRLLWRWGLLRHNVPVQCQSFPRPAEPWYPQVMSDAMRGSNDRLALQVIKHLSKFPPSPPSA